MCGCSAIELSWYSSCWRAVAVACFSCACAWLGSTRPASAICWRSTSGLMLLMAAICCWMKPGGRLAICLCMSASCAQHMPHRTFAASRRTDLASKYLIHWHNCNRPHHLVWRKSGHVFHGLQAFKQHRASIEVAGQSVSEWDVIQINFSGWQKIWAPGAYHFHQIWIHDGQLKRYWSIIGAIPSRGG